MTKFIDYFDIFYVKIHGKRMLNKEVVSYVIKVFSLNEFRYLIYKPLTQKQVSILYTHVIGDQF